MLDFFRRGAGRGLKHRGTEDTEENGREGDGSCAGDGGHGCAGERGWGRKWTRVLTGPVMRDRFWPFMADRAERQHGDRNVELACDCRLIRGPEVFISRRALVS